MVAPTAGCILRRRHKRAAPVAMQRHEAVRASSSPECVAIVSFRYVRMSKIRPIPGIECPPQAKGARMSRRWLLRCALGAGLLASTGVSPLFAQAAQHAGEYSQADIQYGST